ncbi:hypothetical protein EBBID32_14320 [Sphingobium indicum BiD32]|uniref:Uncharacterized protein n=1 Tax=Sphingobium indicum BiD32 TaxID=1301087 RepID=N1MNQ2_9SPHN|nr:hypothetical protein EBBID32_14320 [Sphingobium indicum BiD32]
MRFSAVTFVVEIGDVQRFMRARRVPVEGHGPTASPLGRARAPKEARMG